MARTKASNTVEEATPTTKLVHNRNNYKVELVVDGVAKVLLPGKSVEVPMDYQVPANMGLYVTTH